jgi:hypothetical protein
VLHLEAPSTPPPATPATEDPPPLAADAPCCRDASVLEQADPVAAGGGVSTSPGCAPALLEDEFLVIIEDVLESKDEDEDTVASPSRLRPDDATAAVAAQIGASATPAASDLDVFLVHPSAPAPSPSSTLSPHAAPFHPRGRTEGRPKARRWANDDFLDDSDAEVAPTSTAPYLDAVHRESQPLRSSALPAMSLPRTQPLASARGDAVAGCQGAAQRRGSIVDRAHSWCMACRLGLWRAVSRHTNASDAADGSPPPTPMGGERSSTGRRCDLRRPRLCHVGQHAG